MRSRLNIETRSPGDLVAVLEPGLEGNHAVRHSIEGSDDSVTIRTEVDTIGQLRGSTDGVLRLSSLSKKILDEE